MCVMFPFMHDVCMVCITGGRGGIGKIDVWPYLSLLAVTHTHPRLDFSQSHCMHRHNSHAQILRTIGEMWHFLACRHVVALRDSAPQKHSQC